MPALLLGSVLRMNVSKVSTWAPFSVNLPEPATGSIATAGTIVVGYIIASSPLPAK
jgi:hypothetical protein